MVLAWTAILLAALGQSASPAAAPPQVAIHPSGHTELLVATTFLDAKTGFAVGGTREQGTPGILLRTEDAAHTWTAIDTGIETRLYDIHFPTERVGYAVGLHGAVLKSEDRGRTWRAMPAPGPMWLASVFFTSVTTGYAAGGAQDDMVLLRTDDGAQTWRSLLARVPKERRPRSLRDVRFIDAEQGLVVGDGGGILVTDDAGETWSVRTSEVDAWLRAITFADADHVFVGGTGVVLTSDDAGQTWQRHASPGSEKVNDLWFLDAHSGYATTMDGRLWWTGDAGEHWQRLHDNGGRALCGIAFPEPATGYVVGESGTVLGLTSK